MSASLTIEQISSYYGPGTTLCWIFVFTSVLVSWTLNVERRSKDSIDNDFIALLTFPAVAAGHLIYQIVHFPGGYNNIFTAKRLDLLASLEASLTVCDTFTNYMAPGLLAISFYGIHLKRAGLAGVIMLANLAPQLLLHFQPGALELIVPPSIHGPSKAAGSIGDHSSALSRSSCSFYHPHVIDVTAVTIFVLVVRCIEVILGTSAICALIKRRKAENSASNNMHEQPQRLEPSALAMNQDAFWMRFAALSTAIMLPAVAFLTIATSMGFFGYTIHTGDTPFFERLVFFLPNSNNSVAELDQAVALGAGGVTLLFSVYYAWDSRCTDDSQTTSS